jgi:hypothetical protein
VIPQFVLKELQLVADSADSLKRNRGRRGLDILQKIQKMSGIEVVISDMDFPEVKEVDLKLIELARAPGQDRHQRFQLNKVAQLRGVDVLNVNELANSPSRSCPRRDHEGLHPEGRQGIQPGRRVSRRRDDGRGRQRAQADQQDDRHRRHLCLQTTAGKMIFGRYIEAGMGAGAAAASSAPRRRRSSASGVPLRRADSSSADLDKTSSRRVCRYDAMTRGPADGPRPIESAARTTGSPACSTVTP